MRGTFILFILLSAAAAARGESTYQAFELGGARVADTVTEAMAVSDGQAVGDHSDNRDPAPRALYWPARAAEPIDLSPAGFVSAHATSIAGGHQVGVASDANGFDHAFIWSGTAASGVDLTPAGFNSSYVNDSDGSHQGGYGEPPDTGPHHALIWSGTAASAKDVHPDGYEESFILGVDGDHYVGQAFQGGLFTSHALLWSGDGAVIDLSPAGANVSIAWAVSGDEQVGESGGHAMLWHGSAASGVDITPPGFTDVAARDINNGRIVGWGTGPDGLDHALLWTGANGENVTDLNPFLPRGFSRAQAFGIDSKGEIVGSAELSAAVSENPQFRAILWAPSGATAIPLPAALGPGVALLAGLAARCRLVCSVRFVTRSARP